MLWEFIVKSKEKLKVLLSLGIFEKDLEYNSKFDAKVCSTKFHRNHLPQKGPRNTHQAPG